MRKFLVLPIATLLFISLWTSCGTVTVTGLQNSVDCSVVATPDFATDVVPLFSSRSCSQSNCHVDPTPAGELNLSGTSSAIYASILAAGALDPDTDPADPLHALLLSKPLAGLEPHEGGNNFSDLEDPDYVTIYCWIASGALE